MKPPPLSCAATLRLATRPAANASDQSTTISLRRRYAEPPERGEHPGPLPEKRGSNDILRGTEAAPQRGHRRACLAHSNAHPLVASSSARTAASRSASSGPPDAPSGVCPRAASRRARPSPRRPCARSPRRPACVGVVEQELGLDRLLLLLPRAGRPHPQDRPLLPRARHRRRHVAARPRGERRQLGAAATGAAPHDLSQRAGDGPARGRSAGSSGHRLTVSAQAMRLVQPRRAWCTPRGRSDGRASHSR